MSKLNKKSDSRFSEERLAGGQGLKGANQSPEALLRRAVMACLLFEDMFYEAGDENAANIAALIPQVEPRTVANIAMEARIHQKLRHVPLFIAVEMAKHKYHKQHLDYVIPTVITRADQLTDFLALYWRNGKCPIAKQVQKGLAAAFLKFNAYQFGKYNRDGAIKLRDVMFMVRPKPQNDEQASLFQKIASNTLEVPDTWEVALSNGKDKKETFERLISEGKLGGLAFLRNLRNMRDSGVEYKILKQGFDNLPKATLLPVNFWAAHKMVPEFTREIEAAMLNTYEKLPKLPGFTVFVVDRSGSMGAPLSAKSTINRQEAAYAMAVLANEISERSVIYGTAGKDHNWTHSTQRARNYRGFALAEELAKMPIGMGGIFTRQCLEFIKNDLKEVPDRIIIFSDSQDCDRNNKVPAPFGKYNYIVDVSAYKRGVNFKGVWTAEVSGFSEHFLTFIAQNEGINMNFEQNA